MNDSPRDVVIAGAGPVGLFLACELALAKCSVLVLERAEDPRSPLKHLPFGARGLSAPTIEALYRRGLLDELEVHKRLKDPHANAVQGPRRQLGHFAGIPFHAGDIDSSRWSYRLPSSTAPSLLSEMAELDATLARRAEALGVEIRRGAAIRGFEQTASGVVVEAGESFQAAWLVGCDGSRSVVRKSGGFEFAGTEPEFTGYSLQIDLADAEKLKPGRNVTSRGMYLQSQPGFLIVQDFDAGTFHDSGKPLSVEYVQALIRRISDTDVTVNALHASATWTDRARQATTYRKGRVLLAGDAAHIHAPLGGQGLNLGLGDAMNLGWKLAATIQGRAPEGLLDTYERERHPLGARVLDWSRAQVAIMKTDAAARALYAIVGDLMNTRDGATYFAGRVWGLGTRYELGGQHALAGYSAPNFQFMDGSTLGELMRDGRGLLLDFGWDVALEGMVGEFGDQMKYFCGRTEEPFGLSAMLIRPDGFVAWAVDGAGDREGLRLAAERWFCRVNDGMALRPQDVPHSSEA
jgi:2-polyprenyl-6-methoxyphenol hydroxylase-like FAD-dependent oxidoreductase